MRVRIEMNILQPLMRGIKVVLDEGCDRWVNFKYERLPYFCYYFVGKGCFFQNILLRRNLMTKILFLILIMRTNRLRNLLRLSW